MKTLDGKTVDNTSESVDKPAKVVEKK